jgi:hypothetical protein
MLLSEYEAWLKGLRVDPTHRGHGIGRALMQAAFDWATERGATIARDMVFSWNPKGLGLSRAVGFDPGMEFRWAHPDPNSTTDPSARVHSDVNEAWTYWQRSDARDHLRGLGLHLEESWAISELTRESLAQAAAAESLLVLDEGGTRAFTYRNRVYEREQDNDPQTWAEYGAAAWDDETACADLMAAIASDAASVGADRVRVLIPETPAAVSDVARHRIDVADYPDFVMEADLTAPYHDS